MDKKSSQPVTNKAFRQLCAHHNIGQREKVAQEDFIQNLQGPIENAIYQAVLTMDTSKRNTLTTKDALAAIKIVPEIPNGLYN